MGGAGRMGAWPHRRRPHPMAPNVGALCRGASWPTDPGPGSEGGSLVPPGAGPGPRTCSTRFRSGAYSANRSAAGPDLPVSGHWPGPVLARLTAGPELVADLHRRPGPVLARPNTPWGGWRAALSPGPGPARGHHHDPCAPHHLATWSGTRPGVRRGEYAGPWSQRVACLASGGGYTRRLCTAPVVAGGQFCRNLRIRADPTLFSSLCAQCPRRSGAWTSTRARVALVLILRLRHAHKTGPADRRQTTQDTA